MANTSAHNPNTFTCSLDINLLFHAPYAAHHHHLGLGGDGPLQLLEVDGPVGGGRRGGGPIFGRVQGHIYNLTTGHLNVGDVPASCQ